MCLSVLALSQSGKREREKKKKERKGGEGGREDDCSKPK